MNNSTRKAKIYQEDTIEDLENDRRGVVVRTWHDIEQPQDLEVLEDGEFEVNWLDSFGIYATDRLQGDIVTVEHEDNLEQFRIADRSFGLGDAVKLDTSAPMSGIVQTGTTRLVLRNLATRETMSIMGDKAPVESEKYQIGDYVVCNSWVGIIKDVERLALVMFGTSEIAYCKEYELNPVQYEEGDIFFPDQLPCTTVVIASKNGMKHADYQAGSYSKGISREGVILRSFTSSIIVDWQFQNMMTSNFVARSKPPTVVDLRGQSQAVNKIYAMRMYDGLFSHQIGDIVWRETVDMPEHLKLNSSELNKETLARYCSDWEVLQTRQVLHVRWQDGTSSAHAATELVPYLNVDDLDLWPADHVISKTTGKPGIVQTCNAQERTAMVLWKDESEVHEESLYELMNDGSYDIDLGDLVLVMPENGQVQVQAGASSTWGPSAIVDNISATVSRYISSALFSLQTETVEEQNMSSENLIDWFGQVISIDTNGMCKIMLGYESPTRFLEIPISRLVHVASSRDDDGDDASHTSTEDSDFDIDSTDSESDAYSQQDYTQIASRPAPWTDEDGHIVSIDDQAEWEDETDAMTDDYSSEDDDEDMIDVIAEEVTEPRTTDIILEPEEKPIPVPQNGDSGNKQSDLSSQIHEARIAAESLRGRIKVPMSDRAPVSDPTNMAASDRRTEVAEAAKPIALQPNSFPTSTTDFQPFVVLELEPTDHTFNKEVLNSGSTAMRRIAKEYRTLSESLPPGILVRTFDSRMDLLRALILGPSGTPYEFAPMLFDLWIPPAFPDEPPIVHFHSWTNGIGKINPNLYEEGKVCLSLLGTWAGSSESETWTSQSSLLQIFVSLQALVLVKEPYYNEAGYDILSAKDTAIAAANYSERAYVLTRAFVAHALQHPIQGLEKEISWLYRGPPAFLNLVMTRAEGVVANSEGRDFDAAMADEGDILKVSRGALLLLKRTLKTLMDIAPDPA